MQTNLYQYVYNLLLQIPQGRISTYKAVAQALGDVIAGRAVGEVLSRNTEPGKYPCYKIVMSDGSLGGYTSPLGLNEKIRRLENDGISVKNGKIEDFEKHLFINFKTDFPLKKLRKEQEKLKRKLIIKDNFKKAEILAGIDTSYKDRAAKTACVVMENNKIIEEKTIINEEKFPYIPTYLSYRELPFITKIFKTLENKPDILFIDGNGIIHPKGIGIASHAGLVLDIPTIGVAKKFLCGKIIGNKIFVNGKLSGFVLKRKNFSRIYISPGHRISPEMALEIANKFSKAKLPEPLRLSHEFSRHNYI